MKMSMKSLPRLGTSQPSNQKYAEHIPYGSTLYAAMMGPDIMSAEQCTIMQARYKEAVRRKAGKKRGAPKSLELDRAEQLKASGMTWNEVATTIAGEWHPRSSPSWNLDKLDDYKKRLQQGLRQRRRRARKSSGILRDESTHAYDPLVGPQPT